MFVLCIWHWNTNSLWTFQWDFSSLRVCVRSHVCLWTADLVWSPCTIYRCRIALSSVETGEESREYARHKLNLFIFVVAVRFWQTFHSALYCRFAIQDIFDNVTNELCQCCKTTLKCNGNCTRKSYIRAGSFYIHTVPNIVCQFHSIKHDRLYFYDVPWPHKCRCYHASVTTFKKLTFLTRVSRTSANQFTISRIDRWTDGQADDRKDRWRRSNP